MEAMFAQKIEYFVIGEEPISPDAIMEAGDKYEYHMGKPPKILRLDPTAYSEIVAVIPHHSFDLETILGFEYEIDDKLDQGGWRIGDTEETLRRYPLIKQGGQAQ